MTVRLGFTGDVMLGRNVDRRQGSRRPAAVWGSALDRLSSLSGLLINLESPLSTRGERWTETHRPFHFRADPDWAISALEEAGVVYASLANNHALDFGRIALEDTLDALDEAGIARAGAGRTEDAAWKPARFTADGLDVAVVAFTDNTPEYAAEGDTGGVAHAPIDPDSEDVKSRVRDATARAGDPDLLVASLHWGPNMVTDPPEAFQRVGRWLVEEGVDVVHGHSAHVFQGIEVHEGAPICYDLGDFVDDYAVDPELRNDRGFLFEVRVRDDELEELRLHPVEIRDCAVHEANGDVAEWCRRTMRERSEEFDTAFEREREALVVEL